MDRVHSVTGTLHPLSLCYKGFPEKGEGGEGEISNVFGY